MKKVLLICACSVMLVSCGQQSSDYKKLKAEYETLQKESAQNAEDLNEMLAILEEVESDMQSIRDAENYLTIQKSAGGEVNSDRRQQIKQNMELITTTLKKNKEQIKELEAKMAKGGVQMSAMKKTIARLSAQLDEKTSMVVALQEDLEKKDIRIRELGDMVSTLNEDVESLATTNQEQKKTINKQDKELNTVYYCFGTVKELKAQKILTSGLFSKAKLLPEGFNKDYFISIDRRELTTIPFFAKNAEVKSNHPADSYEMNEDEDGNQTLKILDSQKFWSMSKYLVVVVR